MTLYVHLIKRSFARLPYFLFLSVSHEGTRCNNIQPFNAHIVLSLCPETQDTAWAAAFHLILPDTKLSTKKWAPTEEIQVSHYPAF